MRWGFFVFLMIAVFGPGVFAQEILAEPICFVVKNEANYMIYGSFQTDFFTRSDGTKGRHRSNFRLEKSGTVHADGYPLDAAEFCSSGPFLPGGKLTLTLRTLVPVFECRTRIDQGPIVIKSAVKPGGGTKMYAECYE